MPPSGLPSFICYGLRPCRELIEQDVWPQPKKAAAYQTMFDKTWAFLPRRNGIRINGLHFILQAATLAMLVELVCRYWYVRG